MFGHFTTLCMKALKFVRTNVVNAPFLVSFTPRNIYYRFTSFRIICFTLNSNSNKKKSANKSTKTISAEQRPQVVVIYIIKVTENDLDALSCLTIFPIDMCETQETKILRFSDILLL